ncbi:hypothetical protein BDQ17DRAFT_1429279 [Cyathus striatus]|nr:hypothetical protein BDQ17DRAFT_1429279 [Cyathus striatus]
MPKRKNQQQRFSLFPEIQEEIIHMLWNSPLTSDERNQVLASVLPVNKYWKNTLLQYAFKNIYFTSEQLYKWYMHILRAMTLLGYQDITPAHCQSMTIVYPGSPSTAHKKRVHRNIVSALHHFPNLRRIAVDLVDVQHMGPEGKWDWLKDIPEQVDTLDLTIIAPQKEDTSLQLNVWATAWNSMPILNIKHIRIWGLYDGELAWRLYHSQFPNLDTILCNGDLAERPLNYNRRRWTRTSISEQWSEIDDREIINYDGVLGYFSGLECQCTSPCTLECTMQKVLRALQLQVELLDEDLYTHNYSDSMFESLVLDPVFHEAAARIYEIIWENDLHLFAERIASKYYPSVECYSINHKKRRGDGNLKFSLKYLYLLAFIFVLALLYRYNDSLS